MHKFVLFLFIGVWPTPPNLCLTKKQKNFVDKICLGKGGIFDGIIESWAVMYYT